MPTRSASARARRSASPILHAGEQARQRDVVADGQRRQQVEELEDEADLLAPHPRQLVVAQRRQIAIVERERAAGRPIHGAAEVQQRRLAAARRPHQRDEVAGLDVERHAGERGDPRFAGDIGFVEILGGEQGHLIPLWCRASWKRRSTSLLSWLQPCPPTSSQKFSFTPSLASRGGTMLSGRLNAVPELHCRFCAGFSLNML